MRYSQLSQKCEKPHHRSLSSTLVNATVFSLCMYLQFAAAGQANAQVLVADSFTTRSNGADALRVNTEFSVPSHSLVFGEATVTVTSPKGPVIAERNLEVVLYLQRHRGPAGAVAYHRNLHMPEGSTSVQVKIPVTQFGPVDRNRAMLDWDVGLFEGRRDIEDRRRNRPGQISYQSMRADTQNQRSFGRIISSLADMDTARSDTSTLVGILNSQFLLLDSNGNPRPVSGGTLTGFATGGGPMYRPSDSPSKWQEFLPYSFWLTSKDAIVEMQNFPERAEALRTYVAAGGSLLVYGSSANDTKNAITDWLGRQLVFKSTQQESLQTQYLNGVIVALPDSIEEIGDSAFRETVSSCSADQFLSRLSAQSDANWFWRNLIVTVGKPPIWRFCIAVTLFGIILGPGLLFLTGWLGRRSLMIFLVPAFSLLATLAILSYAVLREGFATHLRINSVTSVDSTTGQSFAWSRQNIFSGMPPRNGLNFASDTYVREVIPNEDSYYSMKDPRKNVDYHAYIGEQQTLSGWLKPRQQQQLLIGHAVANVPFPIGIRKENEEVIVTNRTKQTLPIVTFRGAKDDYYFVQDLGPGASQAVVPDDQPSVNSNVGLVMLDLRPSAPDELSGGGNLLNFLSNYSMNHEMRDILDAAYGDYLSNKSTIPEYGAAVVMREADWLESPVEGESADNLHVVIGELRW